MRTIDLKSGPRESAIRQPAGAHPTGIATVPAPLHQELAEKLRGLPWDLGLSLVSLGAVGVVIPGPVPLGPSFMLLGTVVLCPGLLARTGGPLARRCPYVFRLLIDFTDHLRSDLDRRYPGSLRDGIPSGPVIADRPAPLRSEFVRESD